MACTNVKRGSFLFMSSTHIFIAYSILLRSLDKTFTVWSATEKLAHISFSFFTFPWVKKKIKIILTIEFSKLSIFPHKLRTFTFSLKGALYSRCNTLTAYLIIERAAEWVMGGWHVQCGHRRQKEVSCLMWFHPATQNCMTFKA